MTPKQPLTWRDSGVILGGACSLLILLGAVYDLGKSVAANTGRLTLIEYRLDNIDNSIKRLAAHEGVSVRDIPIPSDPVPRVE